MPVLNAADDTSTVASSLKMAKIIYQLQIAHLKIMHLHFIDLDPNSFISKLIIIMKVN